MAALQHPDRINYTSENGRSQSFEKTSIYTYMQTERDTHEFKDLPTKTYKLDQKLSDLKKKAYFICFTN